MNTKEISVKHPFSEGWINALTAKFMVTPENIPYLAYPIVNFINDQKPDYIIACDRGARIFGFVVHLLYQKIYGPLPTRDHRVNFIRLSRKIPPEFNESRIKEFVSNIPEDTQPTKILVIDDWVYSGKTQSSIRESLSSYPDRNISVQFGVMLGSGKNIDVSGDRNSFAFWDKRDKSNTIGVDYDDNVVPYSLKSKDAIKYRKKLINGIDKFVQRVKQESP